MLAMVIHQAYQIPAELVCQLAGVEDELLYDSHVPDGTFTDVMDPHFSDELKAELEERVWIHEGSRFQIFYYDGGNGWSIILYSRPIPDTPGVSYEESRYMLEYALSLVEISNHLNEEED